MTNEELAETTEAVLIGQYYEVKRLVDHQSWIIIGLLAVETAQLALRFF
ncbi:MAG TPA: hypothetical protein PK805_00315 [Acidovorax temperans]|nr:hypothetical protein [Acidovorax temperans]